MSGPGHGWLSTAGRPIVLGHRGDTRLVRENTIEAFRRALEVGADGVELDVRLSRDGQLVIHHDALLGGHRIRDLNLAELRELAGECGFRLPVLEDVLALADGRIWLDIEIKEVGIEGQVIRTIRAADLRPPLMITSFHDTSIRRVKEMAPRILTGLLLGPLAGYLTRLTLGHRLGGAGIDILLPHRSLLGEWIFRWSARLDIPLLPWGVDDPRVLETLLVPGRVAGVITDEPGLAAGIRDRLPGSRR